MTIKYQASAMTFGNSQNAGRSFFFVGRRLSFGLEFSLILVASLIWAYSSARALLANQSDALLQRLETELSSLSLMPDVLARDPRLGNLLQGEGTSISLSEVMDQWNGRVGSDFIFLMDARGTVQAASNADEPVSFVGRNYGFRPYFNAALNNGAASFFAVGATTGEPGYFLASAVADPVGRHQGALVVKTKLNSLAETTIPPDLTWSLVDDLGYVILSNEPDWLYSVYFQREGQEASALSQQRYQPADFRFGTQATLNGLRLQSTPDGAAMGVEKIVVSEPWKLTLHLPATSFALMVLGRLALLSLIISVVYLSALLFSQQRSRAQVLAAEVAKVSATLKAAQDELVRSESWAALGAMSTAVVHEINQPLNSLRFDLASLDRLGRRGASERDENVVQQILAQIRARGDRLARIIETLRLFTRRHKLNAEPTDLRRVANSAAQRVREERPAASENLAVTAPDDLKEILQVPALLEQVLVNLLTNALAAAQDQSTPSVNLVLKGSMQDYTFEVWDPGPGLGEDFDVELLQPGKSTKPLSEGFGLGLFLSKTFAERMGGTLSYKREGGWTCFALRFSKTNHG